MSTPLLIVIACILIPCIIVYLVMWNRRHEMNRKAEVALKAIAAGQSIDPAFFANKKNDREKVFHYLSEGLFLFGFGLAFIVLGLIFKGTLQPMQMLGFWVPAVIFLFIGLSQLIIYFIAKKKFGE